MNHRRLADAAARLKVFLAEGLTSREAYRTMHFQFEHEKNGWSAPTYEQYVHGTEWMLKMMKVIAATKDAVRLLDHAAKSLPEDMDLFDMRPQAPSGFLYLGQPMMSGTSEVAAYVWWTMPHTIQNESVLIVGTMASDGFGMTNWGIKSQTLQSIRAVMATDVDGEIHRSESSKDDAITDLRVVIAFNLLLDQQVVDTEEVQPTRQMRRQASRHHAPLDPVILVQLPVRHHAAHSNGNGAVPIDWTHRWIVSGHWRKQWYATTETHRPKWIAPYIKGPDDKPLVVKEKLYVFDPKQETE